MPLDVVAANVKRVSKSKQDEFDAYMEEIRKGAGELPPTTPTVGHFGNDFA
jgi:hypothetical protein